MFPESDPEENLEQELTPADIRNAKISLLAVIALLLILSLNFTGCVSAPVAPNLKFPGSECPKLEMPAVPEQVHLSIEGDKIESDAGGDLVLRGYVRARALLK